MNSDLSQLLNSVPRNDRTYNVVWLDQGERRRLSMTSMWKAEFLECIREEGSLPTLVENYPHDGPLTLVAPGHLADTLMSEMCTYLREALLLDPEEVRIMRAERDNQVCLRTSFALPRRLRVLLWRRWAETYSLSDAYSLSSFWMLGAEMPEGSRWVWKDAYNLDEDPLKIETKAEQFSAFSALWTTQSPPFQKDAKKAYQEAPQDDGEDLPSSPLPEEATASSSAAALVPYRSFQEFLQRHRLTAADKGTPFNFLGYPGPYLGKYLITGEEKELFYRLYTSQWEAGTELHLLEKQGPFAPMLIDVDLQSLDGQRVYTPVTLSSFASAVFEFYDKYLHLDPAVHMCYVMERRAPYKYTNKDGKKTFWKDGFHMLFTIYTSVEVRELCREFVLDRCKGVLDALNQSEPNERIVDRAVIQRNAWFMYGSTKAGVEPYQITKVWRADHSVSEDWQTAPMIDLVRGLSVYGPDLEPSLPYREGGEEQLLRAIEKAYPQPKEEKGRLLTPVTRELSSNVCKMVEEGAEKRYNDSSRLPHIARLVLEGLSPARADSYKEWLDVGLVLHWTAVGAREISSDDALALWIDFSRQSPKFRPGECEHMWANFKSGSREKKLTYGSLCHWVKEDNPAKYEEIRKSSIEFDVKRCATNVEGAETAVAYVVERMYRGRYMTTIKGSKDVIWYEFDQSLHRWKIVPKAYTLWNLLPTEVVGVFSQVKNRIGLEGLANNADYEQVKKMVEGISKIEARLMKNAFKENVQKNVATLLLDPEFGERLDSNPHLLCCANGVFDLETCTFREGRPEDYLSISTHVNYVPYSAENPMIKKIMSVLEQIMPDAAQRYYMLKHLGSCLLGINVEQQFYIWQGVGSNGKSILTTLMLQSLGDYATPANVTLLTGKRAASGAANPDLANLVGKRFVVLQEPEDNEKLNAGFMKELTGGDTISMRALYEEQARLKPQFKIVYTSNHFPTITANDNGTWRRIVVVSFRSQFLDAGDLDPTNEHHFPKDTSLEQAFKTEEAKEAFLSILIHFYERYKKDYRETGRGLHPPEIIVRATSKFKERSDIYAEFSSERIEHTGDHGDVLKITALHEEFRKWYRDNYGIPSKENAKMLQRNELKDQMEKKFNRPYNDGWKGYKIVAQDEDAGAS